MARKFHRIFFHVLFILLELLTLIFFHILLRIPLVWKLQLWLTIEKSHGTKYVLIFLVRNSSWLVMNDMATSITHRDVFGTKRWGIAPWSDFNLIFIGFWSSQGCRTIQSWFLFLEISLLTFRLKQWIPSALVDVMEKDPLQRRRRRQRHRKVKFSYCSTLVHLSATFAHF